MFSKTYTLTIPDGVLLNTLQHVFSVNLATRHTSTNTRQYYSDCSFHNTFHCRCTVCSNPAAAVSTTTAVCCSASRREASGCRASHHGAAAAGRPTSWYHHQMCHCSGDPDNTGATHCTARSPGCRIYTTAACCSPTAGQTAVAERYCHMLV